MLIALAPEPGIGSATTCPERKSLPKENGGRRQALSCTVCFVSMPRAEVFSAIAAS
jgi:hypothetical protein